MRKLTIALGITALSIGAATQVNAASNPRCIDFVNFCDGQTLADGPDGNIIGNWVHTDCASGHARIHGRNNDDGSMGVTCTDQGTCPGGFIWFFKFQTDGIFQMYGWDGVNPPFLQQLNQPYTISDGACTGLGEKTGIPSTLR